MRITADPLEADALISDFKARHSPVGLLERYARGRLRHFIHRFYMVALGVISVALIISPQVGIWVLMIAAVGELVETLVLMRLSAWRRAGVSFERLNAVAIVVATLQAMSLSAIFFVTYMARPEPIVAMFCTAFIAGGAISAAMVLNFAFTATMARLVVFGGTIVVYFAERLRENGAFSDGDLFQLLGTLCLAFMVWSYAHRVNQGHNAGFRNGLDLLLRQRDIELKNRELRHSQRENRQLAMVARHANDSVVVADVSGPILWVNDAFTRATGYSLDEAQGRTMADLLNGPKTDPKTIEKISTSIQAGQPCRTEILNYNKSGEQMWMETNIVPLLEDDGTTQIVIAVERNISEAREQARKLADATKAAQAQAKAKSNFLATMSHEIRTPMNGIIGMADVLASSDLSDDQRLHVETIRESGDALIRIINDVLDYSRLEVEKMPIAAEPFSVPNCVKSVIKLMRPMAEEKGLYLDLAFEGPLNRKFLGDAGRLRQVLVNLIGNAVKFTKKGGITISVTATPEPQGMGVEILVDDSGIGIARDRLERIFNTYEQAEEDTAQKFGGTGLGLSISRKLARRMGGDLVIRDKEGPGACFALTLQLGFPLSENGAPQIQRRPAKPAQKADLSGLRILVADDNRTNQLVLDRFLAGTGAAVYTAADGRTAVEMAVMHYPDVILMDLRMPEMSGIEATRAIRTLDLPQPVIFALSASLDNETRAEATLAGMDDYLTKPVDRAGLLQRLGDLKARELPLGPTASDRVSGVEPAKEAPNWTLQPESGTTSGRSTRSSAL